MRPLLVLLAVLAPGPALAADGRALFDQQCASCHAPGQASTADGPSLKGVVGRRVAAAGDFRYSGALKARGGTWTPQRLDAFLKNTQGFAPGTEMFFAIQDAADRQAIVDYLKTVR
jgi:cytochrome c